MKLKARAKVNVCLKVYRKKKTEKLHRIDSVFVACDAIFDTVEINPAELSKVEFVGPWKIAKTNTVWSALKEFREATGIPPKVSVKIVKRIPPGSGLGGASSDAASVLLALGKINQIPLTKLMRIGARVGSDVPFFLTGYNCARVTGHGSAVKKLVARSLHFNVRLVKTACLTAVVYDRFDKSPPVRSPTVDSFLSGKSGPFNDLQQACVESYPAMSAEFEKAGALGMAVLSGSGSSIVVHRKPPKFRINANATTR